MPKIKLSDLTIRSLPIPDKGQVDYWDVSFPAFGVRVSQGGSKTFVIMVRGSRQVISRYPLSSLAQARENARKALYEAKYAPTPKRVSALYSEAVERYLNNVEPQLRKATHDQYRRYLGLLQFPCLLEDIELHDIVVQLDRIEGQVARLAAYNALKIFFNWCVQRDYLQHNPMAKLKKPKGPASRERTLEDHELSAIWHALQDWPDPRYALIVKLCMVTGQRKQQWAALHESWIDFDRKLIRFPREVMKNGEPHTLPFGHLTEFLLRQAQPYEGMYFAPAGIPKPFSAWSKQKAALDKKLALDPWTLHDLRRTWSTNAPRLGIQPHITERVLAHKNPVSKIAGIYDRWKYLPEMREAIQKMEAHITELVTP